MPASDTRQLQLQISASAELLIRNLKTADNAVAEFQRSTDARLSSVDRRFEALGNLKTKLAGLDGGIGVGGLVSAATGVTLVALAQRGLDYASSLGEVSQQLGVTTRDLQVYSYIASQVGIDQETMEKSLAKLTVTLGKARAGAEQPTKAFDALGISIESLEGKSTGDVVAILAEKLERVKDPAKRAALEVEFFGKAGQKLDTLLAGGRSQIDDLTRAASDLGLVLSDEQIQNADATADKLSELKQVLEADVSKVVADNAASIYTLANALITAAGGVARFLSSDPEKAAAILGALAGARFGGLPGAAIGGVVGAAGGSYFKAKRDDESDDLKFRAQKLREARDAYRRDRTAGADTDATFFNLHAEKDGARSHLDTSRRELQKQQRLTERALRNNAAKPKPTAPKPAAEIDPGNFLASPKKPKKGKSAEQLARAAEAEERKQAAEAKRDRADQRRAGDLVSRAQLDLAGARADATADPAERLRIELERVDLAKQGRDRDLEEQALDNKYVAASLDKLKALNAQGAVLEKQLLTQRRAQEIDQSAFDRRRSEQDDAIALAEIAGRLTLIARDRRAIEQRILALRQQEEREALQRVVDDKTGRYSPEEKALAGDQLRRLPERQAAERETLAQDQKGPLGQYRDQLVRNVGDMDEALERVQANGLQSLEDGLLGVLNGTETVASAFKRMAASIIADLARIAVEKAILSAVGGFGLADGGSISSIPGRATGGSLGGRISGPGTGRSDSILALLRGPGGGMVRLSNREFIMNERAVDYYGEDIMSAINARQLPRFADGGALTRRLPTGGVTARRLPPMSAPGGGGDRVMVPITMTINAPGADVAAIARLEAGMARAKAELPGKVIEAYFEAKGRGVIR